MIHTIRGFVLAKKIGGVRSTLTTPSLLLNTTFSLQVYAMAT